MVFTKLNEEQKEQIKTFEVTFGKQASPSLRAMLMRGTAFEDASKIVLESPPKEKKPKEWKEPKEPKEPKVDIFVDTDIKTEPLDVKQKRSYKKKVKTWEDGYQEVLKAEEEKELEQGTEPIVMKKPKKIKNDINIVV